MAIALKQVCRDLSAMGGNEPLFSIIVPTRDRLQSLSKTLLAIRQQTYQNIEIIVVDDGSRGETRSGYTEFWEKLDSRFKRLELGPAGHGGSGPNATRNYGIAQAKGKFIAFCDDDDYWVAPDYLQMAATALTAMPETDIYVGNQRAVERGEVVRPVWLPDLCAEIQQRQRLGALDVYLMERRDLLEAGGFIHLNILIVRRDLIEHIGGFWKYTPYEGDFDFFYRVLDRAKNILFCPAVVAVHCVPDSNKQANVSTRVTAMERIQMRALVCRHIMVEAQDPTIVRFARRSEGDTLRHLTALLLEKQQYAAATACALQALVSRPSLKWLAYTGWLTLLKTVATRFQGGNRFALAVNQYLQRRYL